jgi:hypothetical protein
VTTAVVDRPQNEQSEAWRFLEALVVEHCGAAELDTAVLEMTLAVGTAPPLSEDFPPEPRRRPFVVGMDCVWVPRAAAGTGTRTGTGPPSDAAGSALR